MSIFRLIHSHQDVSRIELAKRTGLSEATLSGIVRRLIKRGLVVEFGKGPTRLGRKPVSLRVCDNVAYFVGVDLGWDCVVAVITDLVGKIVHQVEIETRMEEGRDSVLQRTCTTIRKALHDCHLPKRVIKGIGMSHAGVIDTQNGVVLSYHRPGQMAGWKNLPLKAIVEREFGLPTAVDDHTRMMAVAENYFGNAVGANDFIFVQVSRGIGLSIVINGEIYRGPGGFAGEFGHMTMDENGPLCFCGNNGCLETMSSCTSIIETVRRAILKGVDSAVMDLAERDPDRISIEMVSRAATENDTLASRVLNEGITHLGVALSNVVNLLSPRIVILGGLLFNQAGALLLEPLRRVIKQRAFEKSVNEIQFVISSLGSNAAAMGSARLISEKMLEHVYQERL
ncbi:MAG: ROK family protein [Terriglobia bacterium]